MVCWPAGTDCASRHARQRPRTPAHRILGWATFKYRCLLAVSPHVVCRPSLRCLAVTRPRPPHSSPISTRGIASRFFSLAPLPLRYRRPLRLSRSMAAMATPAPTKCPRQLAPACATFAEAGESSGGEIAGSRLTFPSTPTWLAFHLICIASPPAERLFFSLLSLLLLKSPPRCRPSASLDPCDSRCPPSSPAEPILDRPPRYYQRKRSALLQSLSANRSPRRTPSLRDAALWWNKVRAAQASAPVRRPAARPAQLDAR